MGQGERETSGSNKREGRHGSTKKEGRRLGRRGFAQESTRHERGKGRQKRRTQYARAVPRYVSKVADLRVRILQRNRTFDRGRTLRLLLSLSRPRTHVRRCLTGNSQLRPGRGPDSCLMSSCLGGGYADTHPFSPPHSPLDVRLPVAITEVRYRGLSSEK